MSRDLQRRLRDPWIIAAVRTPVGRYGGALASVRPDDLARLHGPIGLDLGGREPAETALSIMAEIVATRYGGTGISMTEKGRASADRGSSAAPAHTAAASAAGTGAVPGADVRG